MKKYFLLLGILSLFLLSCGEKEEEEIVGELDFTVVEEERLPEELLAMIDEKKATPFKFTFCESGYLYICIGYGEYEQGGYSIIVNTLDELRNGILIDTELLGPKPDKTKSEKKVKSYPYIVVKTQDKDLPVIFD